MAQDRYVGRGGAERGRLVLRRLVGEEAGHDHRALALGEALRAAGEAGQIDPAGWRGRVDDLGEPGRGLGKVLLPSSLTPAETAGHAPAGTEGERGQAR